jgi:hypothetical protein
MEAIHIQFGKVFTVPAKFISYIFHPLFIPTYFFLYLIYQFPYEFASINSFQLKLKIFSVFWMTAFFPAFSVFILRKLKLGIDSIYLNTQKERIIPFFITMFFYWWMYYLSRNFSDQPIVLKYFYFGIFISTSIGVIFNNFIKISLHSIAMGSVLTALILCSLYYQIQLGVAIGIVILLTGIVCTSRLLLNSHTNEEIYWGLIVGAACQLFGYWFVM